jgi:hypothetical protein
MNGGKIVPRTLMHREDHWYLDRSFPPKYLSAFQTQTSKTKQTITSTYQFSSIMFSSLAVSPIYFTNLCSSNSSKTTLTKHTDLNNERPPARTTHRHTPTPTSSTPNSRTAGTLDRKTRRNGSQEDARTGEGAMGEGLGRGH